MRTFDLMCRDNRVVAVLDPVDGEVRAKHGDGVLPTPLLLTGRERWLRNVPARNAASALFLSPVQLGLPEVKIEVAAEPCFEQRKARALRSIRVMGRGDMGRRFLKKLAAENPAHVARHLP